MQQFLYSLIILLFITSNLATAQNTVIQGRIVNNSDNPLSQVSVYIPELSTGTFTDNDGNFKLENISEGEFNVYLSYLGYKSKEISVVVDGDDQIDLGIITMFEGNELLQEVIVSGIRENSFSRKNTAYVSKLPLKNMDNTTVYSTVTNQLLESQLITNFDDAMTNATGISKLWEATGRTPGEGTGYFSTRGFATQPELVDGMPGFTFSAVDPSYIERIEVLKGPAATLFGSTVSSLGGLINVVTKKPYQGFGGSGSYTIGSFGMHRVAVDLNTPLSKKDNLFFRINTSYLTQDSWQDAGFRKTFFVAPSLTYRVNNRLNLLMGVEYSHTEQTNPSMLFLRRGIPMISSEISDLDIDPNKSFTSDDVTLTSPILNTRFIADYKISERINSKTIFASSHSSAEGYYQYLIDGAASAFVSLQSLLDIPYEPLQNDVNEILFESGNLLQQEVFTRVYDKRDAQATKYNVQQNFTGDFNLGKIRNRIVFGLDYVYRENSSNVRSGNPTLLQNSKFPSIIGHLTDLEALGYIPQGTALGFQAQLSGLPYFDGFFNAGGDIVPTTFTPNTKYSVTKDELDNIFNQVPVNSVETRSQTFATYISDVINISKNLFVNVGLRVDYFDQDGNVDDSLDDYTKTTVSPIAGILYQPIPNRLSIFANYQTGFINNDAVVNVDGSVDTFDPTEAAQFEGGVKTNFLSGRLNLGLSYYHITVNNSLNSDPNGVLFPVSIILDETVSQGFEVELNSNPIQGLNLRASYSYNDSEITDAHSSKSDIQYDVLQDRRPEEAGPENIYSFWADYRFTGDNILKNLGLGFGFNGASEHMIMNNGVTGVFTLPSYTIFNATVYYNAPKFRVGCKINNLTDVEYYKGWSTINAQAPLSVLATVQYKF